MNGTAIIVFAKAPQPGLAKTRLIPALGADGAARLAARLLRHAVAQALAAQTGPVQLCIAGDTAHPLVLELSNAHTLAVTPQGEGELGLRMQRALAAALATHAAVLLMGTDLPGLDAAVLRAAAQALQGHDAVFVPALDGGYGLVGLKRPQPALFDGMAWSHPQVMADTRARAAAAGLRLAELPPLHDIDEPADLVHLPAAWRADEAC